MWAGARGRDKSVPTSKPGVTGEHVGHVGCGEEGTASIANDAVATASYLTGFCWSQQGHVGCGEEGTASIANDAVATASYLTGFRWPQQKKPHRIIKVDVSCKTGASAPVLHCGRRSFIGSAIPHLIMAAYCTSVQYPLLFIYGTVHAVSKSTKKSKRKQ